MVVPLFINNASVTSKKIYDVKSAVDDRVIHSVAAVDEDLLEQAIAAAHAALPAWRDTSIQTRQRIFNKAANLLAERAPEFVKIMEEET